MRRSLTSIHTALPADRSHLLASYPATRYLAVRRLVASRLAASRLTSAASPSAAAPPDDPPSPSSSEPDDVHTPPDAFQLPPLDPVAASVYDQVATSMFG